MMRLKAKSTKKLDHRMELSFNPNGIMAINKTNSNMAKLFRKVKVFLFTINDSNAIDPNTTIYIPSCSSMSPMDNASTSWSFRIQKNKNNANKAVKTK